MTLGFLEGLHQIRSIGYFQKYAIFTLLICIYLTFIYFCVFLCGWHVPWHVWKGQLVEAGSLLPCVSWGSNSGHQANLSHLLALLF